MKLFYPIQPTIYITQKFGVNPQMYKQFDMIGHNGIDFRTRFWDSPLGWRYVYAAAEGIVSQIADEGKRGYGKYIRLAHIDGSQTVYAHLKKFYVWAGKVKAKQIIGLSDSTGFSTGSHLHFGYRPIKWKREYHAGFKGYIDPLPFFIDN